VSPLGPDPNLRPRDAIYNTIRSLVSHSGQFYNQTLLASRREMKLHYKQNSEQRHRLQQSHSNFLQCAYVPGPAFVNMLN